MTYLLRKLCPSLANNQTAYSAVNAGGNVSFLQIYLNKILQEAEPLQSDDAVFEVQKGAGFKDPIRFFQPVLGSMIDPTEPRLTGKGDNIRFWQGRTVILIFTADRRIMDIALYLSIGKFNVSVYAYSVLRCVSNRCFKISSQNQGWIYQHDQN